MGTQVTLLYQVTDLGFIPIATLQSEMLGPDSTPPGIGPAVPLDLLQGFGLRLTSDAIGPAPPPNVAQRQIKIAFGPSVAATAVATVDGASGQVESIAVVMGGLDYIKPPIVQIPLPPTDDPDAPHDIEEAEEGRLGQALAEAFLIVGATTIKSGGVGFTGAAHGAFIGGLPPRGYRKNSGLPLCVSNIRVLQGGKGYLATDTIQIIQEDNPQPTVIATGTLVVDAKGTITGVVLTDMGRDYVQAPTAIVNSATGTGAKLTCDMAEGSPAQALLTIVAGIITAITIAAPGDNYVGVPRIVVTDPIGTGFSAFAQMSVGKINVTRRGRGYFTAPPITLTPFFNYHFTTLPGPQAGLFFNLMTGALEASTLSPVIASPPLVT